MSTDEEHRTYILGGMRIRRHSLQISLQLMGCGWRRRGFVILWSWLVVKLEVEVELYSLEIVVCLWNLCYGACIDINVLT